MSIATMMALSIERQRQPIMATAAAASGGGGTTTQKTRDLARPSDEAPQKTLDSAMEKITAFIPSEVIGSYVAVLGIISPETNLGKWVIFGICLLLIPVFMLLSYLTKKKQAKDGQSTSTSTRDTAILLVFAAVAFVA